LQVVADTAGCDLRREIGSAQDVASHIDLDLAAAFRLDEQNAVRLRLVDVVKEDRGIAAKVDAWCTRCIMPYPGEHVTMLSPMVFVADR